MDDMEKENCEKLSSVLSTVLRLQRKSKFVAQTYKYLALICECIFRKQKIFYNNFTYGGSYSEGTFTSNSDHDQMYIISRARVYLDNIHNTTGLDFILRADMSDCSPGYVKLIPVSMNTKKRFSDFVPNIENLIFTTDQNEKYLSSDRFVQGLLCCRRISRKCPLRNGPCSSLTVDLGSFGCTDTDATNAIPLDNWPSEANEWSDRHRNYAWPSKDLVKRVRQQECHVVPVGDKLSPLCFLQWRISFLLGERELMWSFNDTQIHCYTLLKNVLKRFINQLAPKELSSYHLKNVMFWVSEQNDYEMWHSHKLIYCLKVCLEFLRDCIDSSVLDHYIQRKRNLLMGKLTDGIAKRNVLRCIDQVLEDLVSFVIPCVENADFVGMWYAMNKDLSDFLNRVMAYHIGFFNNVIARENRLFTHIIVYECFTTIARCNLTDPNALIQCLSEQNCVSKFLIDRIQMFVNIRSAIERFRHLNIAALCKQLDIQLLKKNIRESLEKHIEVDALSGRLYLATFMFITGKYTKSLDIVETTTYSGAVITYIGQSSEIDTITFVFGRAAFSELPYCSQTTEDEDRKVALDVIFATNDMPFAPYAIKMECACLLLTAGKDNYNFIVQVHPVVYCYYIGFLSSLGIGELGRAHDYLVKLKTAIDDGCKGGSEMYRNMNILGHCYALVGDYSEAIACYRNSLKENPFVGERKSLRFVNAAVYHLLILSVYLQNLKNNYTESEN